MSASRVFSRRTPTGGAYLALVGVRTYRAVPGARAVFAGDESVVPADVETYADSTNPEAMPTLAAESIGNLPLKPLTDVLVRGHARAPSRERVGWVDASIEVAAVRKVVRAHGDRRIVVVAADRLGFGKAEPFAEVALVWDHAYGGRDAVAEAAMQAGVSKTRFGRAREVDMDRLGKLYYPRNGAGRGYVFEMSRPSLEGTSAPNLEDPSDPVTPERLVAETSTDWIDRPIAACFEPIDLFTFPRAQFFIPPKHDPPSGKLPELATGAVLAEDLDRPFRVDGPIHPRLFNCAPSGLAVCRLGGSERVRLMNLYRDRAVAELELPDDPPRMVIVVPGVGEREVRPLLQTVLFEPDHERVTLTWSGILDVAMPYPDEVTAEMKHAVMYKRGARS